MDGGRWEWIGVVSRWVCVCAIRCSVLFLIPYFLFLVGNGGGDAIKYGVIW